MPFNRLIIVLILSCCTVTVAAEEILVAVASNFTAAMKSVAAVYEKESEHRIKFAFGSSGKLYAQIRNGAPYQAFFSADQDKPRLLERDNLGVSNHRFTYAVGTLALYSSNTDISKQGIGILTQGKFNKLAIANPKLAPYGAAAIEVIQHLGIESLVQPKLVFGENITQAFQFVATGNADLGLVALPQVLASGKNLRGSFWTLPKELYTPIYQDAILLQAGSDSRATRNFLNFVREEPAVAIIQSFGYRTINCQMEIIP